MTFIDIAYSFTVAGGAEKDALMDELRDIAGVVPGLDLPALSSALENMLNVRVTRPVIKFGSADVNIIASEEHGIYEINAMEIPNNQQLQALKILAAHGRRAHSRASKSCIYP